MSNVGKFAKDQLEKQGWKEGQGLGRLKNGITCPVQIKMKNNKGGLGHKFGDEFTFHWWDHIFNKTANSIKITTEGEKQLRKGECNENLLSKLLPSKKPTKRIRNGKSLLYGTFVQSGVFYNKNIEVTSEASHSSESDGEDFSNGDTLQKTYDLTGFTGHKAARHGHQLTGKLKRVLSQEKCKVLEGSSIAASTDIKMNKKKTNKTLNSDPDSSRNKKKAKKNDL